MLSDKDKKARYDQFGHAGVDPNFGGGAGGGDPFGGMGVDFGDIFDSFFGGGFGGGRRSNPNAPRRGGDTEAVVTISFEEAAKGCKKNVTYRQIETCKSCGGSGAAKGTQPQTCPQCGGTGQVRISQRTPFGVVQTSRSCDRCRGTGRVIETPCKDCNGTGRIRHQKTVEVTIPAGINDEQVLNIPGHGDAGRNGGPNGDLHTFGVRCPLPSPKRPWAQTSLFPPWMARSAITFTRAPSPGMCLSSRARAFPFWAAVAAATSMSGSPWRFPETSPRSRRKFCGNLKTA